MSTTQISSLSAEKVLLLSTVLASSGDLLRLQNLVATRPTILTRENALRVLLCLPETTPPSAYKPLIDHFLDGPALTVSNDSSQELDTSPVSALSERRTHKRLQHVLPSLGRLGSEQSKEEYVSSFLLKRAESMDNETGALSMVAELLRPFARFPAVKELYEGNVQVLRMLVYEFGREPVPNLATFRAMPSDEALEIMITDPKMVLRDLQQLVVPYMAWRPKSDWENVWARIGALPFMQVFDLVLNWTPPEAVTKEFASWTLGVCYRCPEVSPGVWDELRTVHRRLNELLGGNTEQGTVPERLGDVSDRNNELLKPTHAALRMLELMVTSSSILGKTLMDTTKLRLDGSKDIQLAVLRQHVRAGIDWNKRNDTEWRKVREAANWLLNTSRVLGKLANVEVEKALLSGMLVATRFSLIKELYVDMDGGLPSEDVERSILDAFDEFFSNASNGNKTRGNMKNALQCIQILYPQRSTSPPLERAYRLIAATHALSHYSLTLTPGVPLLPIQIRIHPDPVSIISKLLDSNRRSYLQPDALVSIAKDLALSTSADPPQDLEDSVEARVLGMATEAALTEEDFETAYAYATTRLLPSAAPPPRLPSSSPRLSRRELHPPAPPQASNEVAKDTLWRTSLLAGRFRSQYAALSGVPPRGPAALRQLEKKMELLALAIRFAPPEAVHDVLAQWQRCEEEVEAVTEAESRAEEEHAKLAQGLGRKVESREKGDEGPQSLFEVARGAARVFGKERAPDERRKRDVVSGMVTQGLASGLGWMLGAQPNVGN